jgi:hypothetical protein
VKEKLAADKGSTRQQSRGQRFFGGATGRHDRLGMQFVDSTRAPVPRHSAVGGQQRPSGNREAIPSEVRFGSPTDFTFWLLLLAHYECPNGVRCTLATQVVFAVFPLTSGKPLAAGALIGF